MTFGIDLQMNPNEIPRKVDHCNSFFVCAEIIKDYDGRYIFGKETNIGRSPAGFRSISDVVELVQLGHPKVCRIRFSAPY